MSLDEQLNATLRRLGGDVSPPALDDELEQELAELAPIALRRPKRDMLVFGLVSLLYLGALIGALSLRRDLSALPRLWLVLYVGAWVVGFAALSYVVLVPTSNRIMPNWRMAALLGGSAGAGFVIAGLLLARDVPGLSSVYPTTADSLATHGHHCLRWGVTTALIPVGLGVLFLRGSVPVGDRWAAAALGAGGGCLGGLMLHLHCPITDYLHLGLIHGGVVVLSASLASLIAPRLLS